MNKQFNEEASEILTQAKLEMQALKHPYIGTEHLVLAILHTNLEITEKLAKYNLTYSRFLNEITRIIGKGNKKTDFYLYTPLLKKVLENAINDSVDNNNGIVTVNHLFSSILEIGEGIAIRIFIGMDLDLDNMYDEFREKIYDCGKLKKLLIEELGTNISELAKLDKIDPVIGREKEIAKIEEILCRRTKNNPLLIGEPGVGKTAIIEGIASLIAKKQVPINLEGKKIISLDMASAVSGTKYRGEFEERIKKIIDEIESNDNIILFIDEIHTLIGAGGAEGAIDASNILKPALARGKIRCIGATTIDEYKKHFEKDKALDRRFQTILIEEPSIKETKNILSKLKPIYEDYHNVSIDTPLIDKIIELSERYLTGRFRPDKEIDILDEACSITNISALKTNVNKHSYIKELRDKKDNYIKDNNIEKAYEYKIKETKEMYNNVSKSSRNKVTIKDVASVISSKTNIAIDDILNTNKELINSIESSLNKLCYSKSTIKETISMIKKYKYGYHQRKCKSILITGPIGCGKKTLAKYIGNILSNKIITINLAEYTNSFSISKLIGTSAGFIGYDDNKYQLSIISNYPSSAIIFENIELAHPKILGIIEEILKTSEIKDAKNNLINFKNNTIILVNNHALSSSIGFKDNNISKESIFIEDKVDSIINISGISKENIIKIIKNKLREIKEKYQSINLKINNKIIDELIKDYNYKKYGASKIDKIIEDNLENIIIDKIIENENNIEIDSILTK